MASRRITSHYQPGGGPFTSLRDLTHMRHAAREIDLVAASRVLNPLSGLLTSNIRGRGIDFSEVRIYQPGDDVRTIDWRVTARTSKPHTKLFQEEKERPVLLVVDQCRSMFFGSKVTFKSVIAAQSAALLAWTALDGGDRVGGILFSDGQHREVRPRRSKHAVLKLLREINTYNHALGLAQSDEQADSLGKALASARRVCKHGAVIFVISDFRKYDEAARLHMSQLSRHNDIVGFHVSDPLESSLPLPNVYTITDGTQRAQINTSDSGYREQYRSAYEQQVALLKDEFTRINAPLFELVTNEPVVETIANKYSRYAHSKKRALH